MTSVLQDWVTHLPLRAQGTLLTGMRSCDLAPKNPACIDEAHGCSTGEESPERALAAFLRFLTLNPADAREVGIAGAWFRSSPPFDWKPSQFGHYPLHWFSHIMHCFQICGEYHPEPRLRTYAADIYFRLVKSLHLNPETESQLIERLTEDRIASGTVVS